MKQSRRTFIQKIGAGAAIMSLPAAQGIAGSSLPADKKLGIALLGLGYYAEYKLAVGLEGTRNCYLAGIVTGTPSKADKWKKKYNLADKNIYNYQTFDRIADNPDIGVVYV